MKREFLMLAKSLKDTDKIAGWMISEKLDGVRCFWDGGITRGMPCASVPWANVAKDARYVETRYATGLWTRYGKPIYAPDWWIDTLPPLMLDGELYAGCGGFQHVTSTVKDLVPGTGWHGISYMVFDSPSPAAIFADGKIDNTNYKKKLENTVTWAKEHGAKSLGHMIPFKQVYEELRSIPTPTACYWSVHQQSVVPPIESLAWAKEQAALFVAHGGEGAMVRRAWSPWRPERSSDLLKIKPFEDSEATVIGYTWGRETDLGSKLLGLMGNLVVEWEGKEFELSGFTNEERILSVTEEGYQNPGQRASPLVSSLVFPRGSTVTFKYRELTDAGIPKEARFWRK